MTGLFSTINDDDELMVALYPAKTGIKTGEAE